MQVQFIYEEKIIPNLTEEQMREVDRIAVEDFGLGVLQMMENAGRNLAQRIIEVLKNNPDISEGEIIIIAGNGGNGGGGLCCARHLLNKGYQVKVILSQKTDTLIGPAKHQLTTLLAAKPDIVLKNGETLAINDAAILVDALIGYSLNGPPRGVIKEFILATKSSSAYIISLDIPSGVNATSGKTLGEFITANETLTLALPKTGLINPACGKLFLADIGIAKQVYKKMGIDFEPFWNNEYIIPLKFDHST